MAMSNSVKTILTANAKQANNEVKILRNNFKGLGKDIMDAFNKKSIIGWAGALKNVLDVMINVTKKQSEYAESFNLLDVAYNKNTKSAESLIEKMQTMYGLDPAGLTKQLGVYKQMTNAMGFANETSALLAENLTKMQEDVSSLYNLDFDKVGSKFQSALAGQTRAVRDLGVDITIASLQQELYNRGIDKNVNSLNRASKTALIYLTMERQLVKAHGDAANTIDHLANQTRIFREQISIAARQIGAVFIPVLKAILPYLNGIMMAINQIIGSLLSLFQIDAKGLGKTQSPIISVSNDIDDLGAGLGNATQKAKELKNQLRSFDKLNVITTPTDSGSSSSGGAGVGGGGIDSDILAQLKEYDLADVSMKAQEIRDAFLGWLDVFKPLEEPLKRLSELTFDGLKYLWEHILQPIGKWANETLLPKVVETLASALDAVASVIEFMKPTLKWIMENVVEPFGRVLGKMIINTLDLIKKGFDAIAKSPILQFIVGNTGLIIGFTKLLGVLKNVYIWFGATKLGGLLGTYFDGILVSSIKETKSLTQGWKQFVEVSTMGTTKFQAAMESAKLGVKGLVDAGIGLITVSSSLQDIHENGFQVMNTITLLVGSIMTIKGAIEVTTAAVGILDAVLGTAMATNPFTAILVTLIGATGLIVAISQTTDETKKYIEEVKKANEENKKFVDNLEKEREEVVKRHENDLILIQSTKDYVAELKNITDENGKIKKGYEDRAEFLVGQLNEAYGTEIKIVDGVIQKYKDEIDIIDKLIKKKEVETYLDIKQEEYNNALKNRKSLLEELNKTYDNYTEKEKKVASIEEQIKKEKEKWVQAVNDMNRTARAEAEGRINALQKDLKTEQQALEESKQAYYRTSGAYQKANKEMIEYQQMWVAASEENYDKVIDVYINGGEQVNEEIGKNLIERTRLIKDLGNSEELAAWKDLAKNNVEGYYHDMMEISSAQRKIISDATGVVVDDEEFAKAWGNLAQESEKSFLNRFKQLPKDIQQEVVSKMYQEGYEISAELQKGIKQVNGNIVFKSNTDEVIKEIKKKLNVAGFETTKAINILFGNRKAEGGFLNTGEMFIAREAGPELVGRIGNKTAVANNDQIVNSIAKGLAMSGFGGEQNVNIIAKGDTQGLMNFITFEQQRQNRQYGM